MRKVYILVQTRLIVEMEEGLEVGEFIQDMDYNFIPGSDHNATVIDTEIIDFEVLDSK